VDFDVHLRSRRATETELRTVIELLDFCEEQPHYNPFWHNRWIEVDD